MIQTHQCPKCLDQLTPITTVTTIMSTPEATYNDKKVRRGMSSHRACRFCDLIYRIDLKKGIILGNI